MKFFSLILPIFLLVASPALSQRVALLIANHDYDNPAFKLANPSNDVASLAEALRRLEFDVTEAVNQTRQQMQETLHRFAKDAQGSEMAVFFYAGHGVQLANENYLIARDFPGTSAADLAATALTMSEVRRALERAQPQAAILVLDACRNNPFSNSGMVPRGLSRTRGGAGLLIAYATDPGNVAFDGLGQNSIFTSALLDHIATPGLDVRLMLGRVRQQVVLDTSGQQVPWVEEALLGEHKLVEGERALPDDEVVTEMHRWREVAAQGTVSAYRGYLRDFPDGLFVAIASDLIANSSKARVANVPEDTQQLLAGADVKSVSAALTTLGLLPQARGLTIIDKTNLKLAFETYLAQLDNPEAFAVEDLYDEATWVSMLLASATSQRIRTDLVALRSVGRTLEVAFDAVAEIEKIAQSNADALPILEQARADIADIRGAEATILARLDQSRTYYAQLLENATYFAPDGSSVTLLQGSGRGQAFAPTDQRVLRDAGLFLRHVRDARGDKEGSLAWMADLLPSG